MIGANIEDRLKALEDGLQLITDRLIMLTANENYIDHLLSDAERAEKVIIKIKVLENRALHFENRINEINWLISEVRNFEHTFDGYKEELKGIVMDFKDQLDSFNTVKYLVDLGRAIRGVVEE